MNKSQDVIVMTGREVSKYLKIPISTLYDQTKKGKIRGIKIGKHWRYVLQDIHDFLLGRSPEFSKSTPGVIQADAV